MTEAAGKTDWRHHGVRIVKSSELDFNTPQTPGMTHAAAINFAKAVDFIYVPPYVPHQEINARSDAPLECVLVRTDQGPVVVNLDIVPAEHPEEVRWIDPNHPQG